MDLGERRSWRDQTTVLKVFMDALLRNRKMGGVVRHEGRDFRGKAGDAIGKGKKEGTFARSVAREEKLLFARVPNRDSKNALETLDKIFAKFEIEFWDNRDVRLLFNGASASRQPTADFKMVIDFPITNRYDPGGAVDDGLLAGADSTDG